MDLNAVFAGLLALAGLSGALYSLYSREPMALSVPLGYFSLMAALQAFAHTVAGQCGLPANQVATLLAYFHVCFQPFFINAAALHFIDRKVAGKIDLYVYSGCFISLVMMLIQVYPFAWAGRCAPGSLMCGETLCALSEGWKTSWLLPITQFADTVPWYFLALALPLLYGSWRFMLAYGIACLLPAYFITQNLNSWPGASAQLAIPFLLLVIMLDEMRNRMVITRWYWRLQPVVR